MLNSAQIETIKNGLSLAGYVREELKKRSVSPDSIDKDVVSAIISSSTEAKDKLPQDPTTQESLYKVIAAQIKISNEISGKDSISKDDLIKLLGDPCVAEAIQETGLEVGKISKTLESTFDKLPTLANYAENPLAAMFLPFDISNDEISKLNKKEIPMLLLPKLLSASKNPIVNEFLNNMGVSVELFELLPLLLNGKADTEVAKPASSLPLQVTDSNPEAQEAVKQIVDAVGKQLPKSTTDTTQPGNTKGWLSWWGTYAIGGGVLALVGVGGLVVWKTMD